MKSGNSAYGRAEDIGKHHNLETRKTGRQTKSKESATIIKKRLGYNGIDKSTGKKRTAHKQ